MKFTPVNLLLVVAFHVFLVVDRRSAMMVTGTILSGTEIVLNDSCGRNEVYSQCGARPNCEKSCDNIDIWEYLPCALMYSYTCNSGCICMEGYVRDRTRDACVLENSCPRVRH